jgi:uncharacterized membrane protein YfhO
LETIVPIGAKKMNVSFVPHIWPEASEKSRGEALFDGVEVHKVPDEWKKTPSRKSVKIVEYSPNKIIMKTENLNDAAFLVITDSFDKGWKASVDGINTKIYRTNFSFKGIALEKGKHHVELIYEPFYFKLGAVISIITAIAMGLFLIANVYIRKNRDFK